MAETKKCEDCDAVIAKDEKVCPACKLDYESLEDNLKEFERLDRIRKKREAAKNPPKPVPELKKKGLFGGLKK